MAEDQDLKWRLLVGDVRAEIKKLEDQSVDCVMTSPPYYSLRDYDHPDQIGLEPTLDEYLDELVGVFREVRRVLKRTGVLWLNLGDTYVGSRKGSTGKTSLLGSRRNSDEALKVARVPRRFTGMRKKDLVGLPWRVAFALQANGWRLRCDVVWSKPCVTPESVVDRPTREHEYVFLLSRSLRYWYDAAAIAEPSVTPRKGPRPVTKKSRDVSEREVRGHAGFAEAIAGGVEMRNARSVWTIAQVPEPKLHTATFPPELARRCILAGCPPDGVVFDPFAGYATAGAAALALGRRFVGIELNPEYAVVARERLVEALEFRGEATPEDAAHKHGPTQLGLLSRLA